MAQTEALVATLKTALKLRGLTYRNVAKALGLSEASVKRLFAQSGFSLARLDTLCSLMGIEITDLVEMMEVGRSRISELTQRQEQELVSDTELLLVAFLMVNSWTFHEILDYYTLPESEVIRCLARLDRLKLIELLPKNHIKLLILPNFAWRKNGPIEEFFNTHMREDFLKSRFDAEGEGFLFISGMLSRSSNEVLRKKFEQLAAEFDDLNRQDRRLPIAQRFGSSMILAMRPWRPAVFERFLRKKD